MEHLESCAVGKESGICSRPHELSDGTHHWWSGWPGAFCLGCGTEDAMEICLGDNCKCQCHWAFWKEYEEYCKQFDQEV